MIDNVTRNKILDAANIVDVVGDFVTLKRAGANYKGLCPFHDDRTPSFMVSPAKNYCKCFACGKGGNPVGFIMEHEQLSYPDALRWLAKKYGITIEERELTPEEKASKTERESLFIVNEWANKWFQDQMYETADGKAIGLAYFRGRGFRDDIIKKFQLGYCPSGRDKCTQAALKAGYKEEFLVSTPDADGIAHGVGITIKHDDGKIFDRFSGRVMFPIFTISGKVVGFGGRVLDSATKGVNVKYQNSPESIIYHKKSELYGLFQAKQAIVKNDCCFMVEGYTDVMAMHQNGVENVVASSGTALTHEQIRLLHRFTSNIVVLYDGDAAGIKASQRGIDMLLREGMNVKLMLLPDGKDPDEFGREHTAQEFQTYMKEHQVDFIKFKTDLLLKEAKGDPIQLSRLVNNIVQSIAVVPDEITRTFYIRETAQMMQMQERLITEAVSKQVQKNIEEWRKERERETRRATQQGNTSSGQGTTPAQQAQGNPTMGQAQGTMYQGQGGTTYQGQGNATYQGQGGTTYQGQGSTMGQEPIPADAYLPEDYPPPPEFDQPIYPNNISSQPSQPYVQPGPVSYLKNESNTQLAKEKLIIQMVIRHGETLICNAKNAEGEEVALSVAEYIFIALQEDQLILQDALQQKVLEEAVAHVHDEGFKAERYFLNHPSQDISSLAFELATDKEELSKYYTQQKDEHLDAAGQMMDQVNHLLIDLKLCIVEKQKKELMLQMRNPEVVKSKERCRELIIEFQQIKEVENALAKACGDRVFMH